MYAKRLSNYSTHLINLNRKDIFYDALCIDYTAAYLCDLMADTMTVIKKNHSPTVLPKNSSLAAYNAILNGYGILIILLS